MVSGILLLKLLLAPALTTSVTLATRRWGNAVGGWLAGLPLLAGPVSLLFAIQFGLPFAQAAAHGTILGLVGVCSFILCYAALAEARRWTTALPGGLAAFVLTLAVLRWADPSFLVSVALLLAALFLCLRAAPMVDCKPTPGGANRWDLPLRIAVVTGLVVGITAAAPLLGSSLSGLVSPIPVFTIVFVVIAHRTRTTRAVKRLLRGATASLFGFGAFFVMVHSLPGKLGVGTTYLVALLSVFLVNIVTFNYLVRVRS